MDHFMDISLKAKKRLTNISTGLFFLFGGIEYAIIMPTVYLYIQKLGGDPSFLGLVLSAFSFSGLIAAPIFGILQDRYHNTKTLVLVANMFEIIGNFMYFMGMSLTMLLGSRFVAGIGAGVGSSLFAQIARTTTEAERAAAISVAMAARQVGLLFGPGLNLFLEHVHFYIGPWVVDAYSSAGIFMCLLWILLQVFIFFFYFDLPPLSEDPDHNSNLNAANTSSQSLDQSPAKSQSSSINVLTSGRPKVKNASQSLPTAPLSTSFEEGGVLNITPMWSSSTLVEDARPRAFSTTSRELVHPSGYSDSKQDGMQNVDLDSDNLYDPPQEDGTGQFPGLNTVKEDEDQLNKSCAYGSTGQKSGGSDQRPSDEARASGGARSWKDEYLREEIVVLLASQFIFFFNQTVLETAITPMTQKLLGFGELENSILYCICGVEIVIGFVIVKYLSKYVSDRTLLLTGFIIELISVIWLLIFYPRANPGHKYKSYNMMWFSIGVIVEVSGLAFLAVSIISLFSKITSMESQDDRTTNLVLLAISVFIQISGLPFIAVAIISLFSKITPQETQGLSQGIRRAVGGLATILGPLWAGGTVEMGYVMFGVMTFFFSFSICLMLLSWSKLKAPADIAKEKMKQNLAPSTDDSYDEKSPLLINADDEDIEA